MLKKLTAKEKDCLLNYVLNKDKGCSKTDAYKSAYNTENMSDASVAVEASRFFNKPKIKEYLEQIENNQQKAIENELNYRAIDAMNEYNSLQEKCMQSNKTYNVAKGCIDSKCKLAGLFADENKTELNNYVVMGDVEVDGETLNFDVGADD